MVTVSSTATLPASALCERQAAVATLSKVMSKLPFTATAMTKAKVKLARRELRCAVVNMVISPI